MTSTAFGRDPEGSGSRPSDQARSGLGGSRFDPSRIAEVAQIIEAASVPHESGLLGAGRRTLGYYASVGIDYLDHPHERYQELLNNAAVAVLRFLQSEEGDHETA